MPANLTFDALREDVATGEIDTVIVALVDMQGRLMGKRFHAEHFLENGHEETHCCNYLLATDLEMTTVPGYAATGWDQRLRRLVMKPDLTTLRRIPWAPGTALCLATCWTTTRTSRCRMRRATSSRRQIARAEAMGLTPMMATELEFFLFHERPRSRISTPATASFAPPRGYNVDYALPDLRGRAGDARAAERPLWRGHPGRELEGRGRGRPARDQHQVFGRAGHRRHACAREGRDARRSRRPTASPRPSWRSMRTGMAGSSSHVHQSLFKGRAKPAFHDADAPHGMSAMMQRYIAGQLAHARR